MRNLIFIGMALVGSSFGLAYAQQQPQPQSRGALGITMSDNTRGGVLITNVLPGSPAASIGLQSGDRILAVNGTRVFDYRDVANLIGKQKPNSRVQLRVDRGGWTNTLEVTVGNAGRVLAARPVNVPPRTAPAPLTVPSRVQQGSLVAPQLQDLTPADIDDQHGYGG